MTDLDAIPKAAAEAKLDELEELARNATPGPWYVEQRDEAKLLGTWKITKIRSASVRIDHVAFPFDKVVIRQEDWYTHPDEADSLYIASASPDVMLALIATVRRIQRERDEAQMEYSDSWHGADELRALLTKTAERAHKTGCRPITGLAADFFNWDWLSCRNQECVEIRALLHPPPPTLQERLKGALDGAKDEFQRAPTGTPEESFHEGRVSAYVHALEEVERWTHD